MGTFTREIWAYALRNAIEFGRADASKILPKLFQHGLDRGEVKNVIGEIQEIVKKVNKMNEKERLKEAVKYRNIVKVSKEREGLQELKNVGKKVVLRVAPFPSGALHLGNAKTLILNGLYAEKYKGKLFLVIDDTIGSEKKPVEIDSYKLIEEAMKFLKLKKSGKTIYKSDRLKIYYDHAKILIDKDAAYVCHCYKDEMKKNRDVGKECGCRVLPVKIQKLRWKEMFKMKEGHAILRIKTSMQDPNPAFRDRVLFKISDRVHPKVGKKYRVWPTLEMSWAVDDHLLGITHIIRGNELMMESQMERFIWKIFGWKEPEIIHTGLVMLEGEAGKISKSKSREEVKSGKYKGWDDPRTWSIQSLEKRGISAEAIRKFVEGIGLNKQNINVPIETLYSLNRQILDKEADRYSFVMNPVKLVIEKSPEWNVVQLPIHPDKTDTREVVLNDVFISLEDFKRFKGKEVRLLHLYNIKLGKKSRVTEIEGLLKNKINWVSEYVNARVLFPNGKWMEGVVDSGVNELKEGKVVQFERFGFVRFNGVVSKEEGQIYDFWFGHK
jgi:glutamyl-tRNA synthetase